jgi:hypothetical protein
MNHGWSDLRSTDNLNAKLRRSVKTRGHFPNDDAAMRLLLLVLRHAVMTWKMQPRECVAARTPFSIIFEDKIFAVFCMWPPTKIADTPPVAADRSAARIWYGVPVRNEG